MGLGLSSTSADAPDDARIRVAIAAGSVKHSMQRKVLAGTIMAILPVLAACLIRRKPLPS
jgi:hypothetical protein